MPEVPFTVRWPDGNSLSCRSPSTAIRLHLSSGTYGLDEFMGRARAGLQAASERVREVYGFPCAQAASQLQAIEAAARHFDDVADACVTVHIS